VNKTITNKFNKVRRIKITQSNDRGTLFTISLTMVKKKKKKKGRVIIALAHNYKQNGDTIPDPDMQIRIFSSSSSKVSALLPSKNIFIFFIKKCNRIHCMSKEIYHFQL